MKLNEMDKAVLLRLRNFFRKDWETDRRERGCLVALNGDIIPFDNLSHNPAHTIAMGHQGFMALCDLVAAHNLDCWAHSHPVWPARPSNMDIREHNIPNDMLIYSCIDDEFARFTTADIIALETRINEQTINTIATQGDIKDGDIRTQHRSKSAAGAYRRGRHRQLVLP